MPRLPKNRSATEDGPHTVDAHVGARIRLRRTLLGLSQTALADAIGLTFQQVQKYEKGSNRVSAGRLWQFAQVLEVPVAFFFDELTPDFAARGHGAPALASAPTPAGRAASVMTKRETLELVHAYYRIANPVVRLRLLELTTALGADPTAPEVA